MGIISDLLKDTNNGSVLIVGDMNWDFPSATNAMKEFLSVNNFSQMVTNPTHEDGGLLDHVYVKLEDDSNNTVNVDQRAKYYTDHDAIFIGIK